MAKKKKQTIRKNWMRFLEVPNAGIGGTIIKVKSNTNSEQR